MPAFASGSRRALTNLVYSARRRSRIGGPRLGTCMALVAVSVVAGGLLAVLLVFFALVLVIDAVLPMPGHTWSEADDRFSRLVRQRGRARLARRLRRLGPDDLEVLDDAAGWAAVAERRALGVAPIPLDSISGTVESMKARSFDGCFRPARASSEHWKRLWIAQARGASLPPISVYRVNGRHVVRDGHHRVSVARDHGLSSIDADVVELL
ncbi:MAG: hypothetical protein QOD44_2553 [Solirubrobacteraceae bacterium]|jgi:hypothetical protein|nr:hypothetical protein [Solirubrobacteraceae bacterium]MEA2318364.1 hypothetical protein [Solirubrobacteraceae bacterium]